MEQLRREHGEKVAAVKLEQNRTLLRAGVQLAATLAKDDQVKRVVDVSRRRGFDPDNPADILTEVELRHLPGAILVINAIKDSLDLALRLENQETPRVTGGGVYQGGV